LQASAGPRGEREREDGRVASCSETHAWLGADLAQSAAGNTVVKAYRLSPSFIDSHRKGKFTAAE